MLIPHLNEPLETGGAERITLAEESVFFSEEQLNGMAAQAGYRIRLPKAVTLHWPALPHNPYRKDGHATPAEGRIEIRIPLDKKDSAYRVILEIPERSGCSCGSANQLVRRGRLV